MTVTFEQLLSLASQFRAQAAPVERDVTRAQYLALLDEALDSGFCGALGSAAELPDELMPTRYRRRRAAACDALENELAAAAMAYRGAASDDDALRAVDRYHAVYDQLRWANTGWHGEPDVDTQLPFDLMPASYLAARAERLGAHRSSKLPPR